MSINKQHNEKKIEIRARQRSVALELLHQMEKHTDETTFVAHFRQCQHQMISDTGIALVLEMSGNLLKKSASHNWFEAAATVLEWQKAQPSRPWPWISGMSAVTSIEMARFLLDAGIPDRGQSWLSWRAGIEHPLGVFELCFERAQAHYQSLDITSLMIEAGKNGILSHLRLIAPYANTDDVVLTMLEVVIHGKNKQTDILDFLYTPDVGRRALEALRKDTQGKGMQYLRELVKSDQLRDVLGTQLGGQGQAPKGRKL